MTSVLITGASGMVGSNVLDYLLDRTDWTFTCLCSWRHRGSPLHIVPNQRVTVVTHDLTGPIPEVGTFDYILHLASESHVDRAIADPVGVIENNVSSTLQILEYARSHVPQAFLLFSSDEVYGTREHDEWDLLLPSNPYAASKAAAEVISLAYWRTYGVPLIITNSNNIVGRNQHAEKFVPKVASLVRAGLTVPIHTSSGVLGKRFYNPVRNVADALLFILEQLVPSTTAALPYRFNIPGGSEMDNLEMAQLIADTIGLPLHYELVDVADVRPGYDTSYAQTNGVLIGHGWYPPVTLREGLAWLRSTS